MKITKVSKLFNGSTTNNEILRLLEMIYGNFDSFAIEDTYGDLHFLKSIIAFEAQDYLINDKILNVIKKSRLYFKSTDMYHYFYINENTDIMYIINIAELKQVNENLFNELFLYNKNNIGFLPISLITQLTNQERKWLSLSEDSYDINNIINTNYNNISAINNNNDDQYERAIYKFNLFLFEKEDFYNFFDNENYGFHLIIPPSGASRNNEEFDFMQDRLIDPDYSEEQKFSYIDKYTDNYSQYHYIAKEMIKEQIDLDGILESMKHHQYPIILNGLTLIRDNINEDEGIIEEYEISIYYRFSGGFDSYLNSK